MSCMSQSLNLFSISISLLGAGLVFSDQGFDFGLVLAPPIGAHFFKSLAFNFDFVCPVPGAAPGVGRLEVVR